MASIFFNYKQRNTEKHHFQEVIKNECYDDNSVIIWKHRTEDFNTNSTLVVQPGETVLFINMGKIEEEFKEPGTYILNTENYPFITRLKSMLRDGQRQYTCSIYFVRNTELAEQKWGTLPVESRDAIFNFLVSVSAAGAYRLKILDPAALVTKITGVSFYKWTIYDFEIYFRNQIQNEVGYVLEKFVSEYDKDIVNLSGEKEELSRRVQNHLYNLLLPYGVQLTYFSVMNIAIDKEGIEAVNQANINRILQLQEAQTKSDFIDVMGKDKYYTEKSIELLDTLFGNSAYGGSTHAIAGWQQASSVSNTAEILAQNIFSSSKILEKGSNKSKDDRIDQIEEENPYLQKSNIQKKQELSNDDRMNSDDIRLFQVYKKMFENEQLTKEEYIEKINELFDTNSKI